MEYLKSIGLVYSLEYKSPINSIIFKGNTFSYFALIIGTIVLLTMNIVQNSPFDYKIILFFVVLVIILIGLGQIIYIPLFLNMSKYKKLDIYHDKISINNSKFYNLADITFQSELNDYGEGPIWESLIFYDNKNKKIGQFYFLLDFYLFYKMDINVIIEALSDLKNNVNKDYQKLVFENIQKNCIEKKENKKSLSLLYILVSFPLITIIFFFLFIKY